MIELHLENAASMWASRHPGATRGDGYFLTEHPAGARAILLDATASPEKVLALAPNRPLLIEDAFGILPGGTLRMPIMIRDPQHPPTLTPSGVRVTEATDPEELAVAEQVMVDGFPFPAYQPWSPGQALPPSLLRNPGWQFWLARIDSSPAAAAYTFDDGTTTGVYWLATMPEHRSRGAARAILSTAIAARPDRPFTLVATEAGRPLYESLGFTTATTTTWQTRPPVQQPQPPPHPAKAG
ncbi:GNAT family N-acetyltransferase [Actinoplanes lutulentus]|nr:GNAT family N-acetyltransferase [Actinoplanes lutulentus]